MLEQTSIAMPTDSNTFGALSATLTEIASARIWVKPSSARQWSPFPT